MIATANVSWRVASTTCTRNKRKQKIHYTICTVFGPVHLTFTEYSVVDVVFSVVKNS